MTKVAQPSEWTNADLTLGSDGLYYSNPAQAPAGPAPGDVFNADYSDPNLGGSNADSDGNEGILYTRELVPSGGPDNRPFRRLSQISALGEENFGGQYKWGDSWNASNFGSGVSRFYRFYVRVSADTNFRGVNWDDGLDAPSRNKLIIIADGGDGSRFILNLDGTVEDGEFHFLLTIDGADSDPSIDFPLEVWHAVQAEMRWVTGGISYAKLWVDTDDYENPTLLLESSGRILPATNGFTQLGCFNNNGLRGDGIFLFDTTDMRAATTYDSNWFGSL